MAYKDKDKQREAVRLATRRYRERKGITKAVKDVIPCDTLDVIPSKPEQQSHNPMMAGYVPPGRNQ